MIDALTGNLEKKKEGSRGAKGRRRVRGYVGRTTQALPLGAQFGSHLAQCPDPGVGLV
jgi:hypothetical protein